MAGTRLFPMGVIGHPTALASRVGRGAVRICSSSTSAVPLSSGDAPVPFESAPSFESEILTKGKRGLRGSTVRVKCERLAYGGLGVCLLPSTPASAAEGTNERRVLLCKGALPGEELIARVVKAKRGMAEGYKIESLGGTIDGKIEKPPCPLFGDCGGCKHMDLEYEVQLRYKEEQLRDLLSRIGGFEADVVQELMLPIVGCIGEGGGKEVSSGGKFRYRNKMEFSFGKKRWRTREEMAALAAETNPSDGVDDTSERITVPRVEELTLGLHVPGFWDRILQVEECLIQHESADKVLKHCFSELRRLQLTAYDPNTYEGYLRSLTIRKGSDPETDEPRFMVNIFTRDDSYVHALQEVASTLVSEFPEVTSVINQIGDGKSGAPVAEEEILLAGDSEIYETLSGLNFAISASSFFQTNPSQAQILYDKVKDACGFRPGQVDTLLDLFCGTGTIGLTCSNEVEQVVGFEIVEAAVSDARKNALRNKITNATFYQGDLNKLEQSIGSKHIPAPDVVITDPARPGMHHKLVKWLNTCGCRRIVYVSCNPSTLARDLAMLCGTSRSERDIGGGRYKLNQIQAIDMFPHTSHIEAIAVLDLK